MTSPHRNVGGFYFIKLSKNALRENVVWQIRITLYTRHLDRFPQFVWHVHVLPMFTFREQYELVNKKYVLQTAL
jgi:hypothetical protein